MPKYKVYVEWVSTAIVEVEADCLESAIDEVNSNDSLIPTEGDYLDGSLDINQEISRQMNRHLMV